MESEQLMALEQALAELQAKDANTQHKLDILVSQITSSHIPQSENPTPSTQPTPVTLKVHGLKLALALEFDGDRTKGMAFVNLCQVYIRLCPNSFLDKQAKIVGAMSYMKAVRATAGRLSRDLAGDPKHIYKHKIQQESAPSRGS